MSFGGFLFGSLRLVHAGILAAITAAQSDRQSRGRRSPRPDAGGACCWFHGQIENSYGNTLTFQRLMKASATKNVPASWRMPHFSRRILNFLERLVFYPCICRPISLWRYLPVGVRASFPVHIIQNILYYEEINTGFLPVLLLVSSLLRSVKTTGVTRRRIRAYLYRRSGRRFRSPG